jgi:uncharacterized membrane protein YqjE
MQEPTNDDVHARIRDDLHEASLGEVAKQLTQDVSMLIKQEVALAKAELSEKGKQLGVGGALLGGAAVAGWMALVALTLCLVFLLALAMPTWVAALIVTVIWAAMAGVLALRGRDRIKAGSPPVPEQTIETVKEDVQWLKNRS